MKAPYPFGFIGDGITRCIALALPSSKVRAILPAGLELGEQDITPKGTHPVVLQFHGFIHCQFSFPTFLPPMDFHEQTFGIPFTYVSPGRGAFAAQGPYYFMPKLYLDDLWVLMVGRNFWGFDKQMARVTVTENRYSVTSFAGKQLVSLAWSGRENEPRAAIGGYAEFEPVRQMLDQTLISLSPATILPVTGFTDFDRRWNLATVRPLSTDLEIDPSYLPGFEGGRYSTAGQARDTALSMIGSYELSAQWSLSFPYLPPGPVQWQPFASAGRYR